MHDLAALLLDRRQRRERALCDEAGFLGEFALRGRERIAVGFDQAFRNAPGAGVLLRPERSAGMRKKYFRRRAAPEDEEAGAHFGCPAHVSLPQVTAVGASTSMS